MLGKSPPIAFLATTHPDRAKLFYQETVGLRLVSDDEFAIVFDAAGIPLRVQKVRALTPHPFTAFGWQVGDIRHAVTELVGRGVSFERYPFLQQDALGIWAAPSGASVAWFKDPDGNLLSVTQTGAD
jgi:catechol 2,3-dioxygenase-like lactoylglutathione lyase family enzyme